VCGLRKSKTSKGFKVVDLKIDTVEVWGSSPHVPTISFSTTCGTRLNYGYKKSPLASSVSRSGRILSATLPMSLLIAVARQEPSRTIWIQYSESLQQERGKLRAWPLRQRTTFVGVSIIPESKSNR